MVKATGPVFGLMRTEPTARGARRRLGGASAAVRVSAFVPEEPLVAPDASVPDEATAESDLLPLDTRPVRLVDLAGLRRVDDVHRLNQPETQLSPYSPLRAGLAAAMPGFRARRPFFVASAVERLVGYAHFSPVPPDQRWHLLALGAS